MLFFYFALYMVSMQQVRYRYIYHHSPPTARIYMPVSSSPPCYFASSVQQAALLRRFYSVFRLRFVSGSLSFCSFMVSCLFVLCCAFSYPIPCESGRKETFSLTLIGPKTTATTGQRKIKYPSMGSRFSARPSHRYCPAELPPFAEVVDTVWVPGSRFSTRPSHGYCPAEVPPFAVVDCTTVVTHIPMWQSLLL